MSQDGRVKMIIEKGIRGFMKNSTKLFSVDNHRIDWIDIAKGIAILLVIIGHTVKFGSASRTFIFSFHMPLFFVLSGYTYRVAEDFATFKKHVLNNIKHLLIPAIGIVLFNLLAHWILEGTYTMPALAHQAKYYLAAFFWASGVKVGPYPALGAAWFLVSLLGAKLILDSVWLLFGKKECGYLVVLVALLGMALGVKRRWLPFNLDVTMVVVFFLYAGMLLRRYSSILSNYRGVLFGIAVVVWITCLNFGFHIELASRKYPFLVLSILEGIFGTMAICNFCKGFAVRQRISNVLRFIGCHTLLIFSIHCVDWTGYFIWRNPNMWNASLLRCGFVLIVSLILYTIHGYFLKTRGVLKLS